jgi:AraC-like DNA-binding protein
MVTWTTDTVVPRERFSYWREMICNTLFSISPEAPAEQFSASLTAHTSGRCRFAMCESTSYEIIRTQRDISRAPADLYTVYLQRRGRTLINQCDQSIEFQRNDIVLSDCRQPYSAKLSNDGHRAVALLPRDMIEWRAPWLRDRPLSKLNTNSPFLELARQHFMHLVSGKLSETESSLLTDNLCNLLALASATGVEPDRMRPELQLQAMVAFCQQNLHRPDLTPQVVAVYCGVSVRTLHLRFKTLGQTFGSWLLEARLNACSRALKDPYQTALTISEIAYSCGFNDLSHFNKTFRTRFGMTPREFRFEFVKAQ